MRIFKNIAITFFVIISLLIIAIGVLVYLKADTVKAYVLSQVNEAGEGIISVESVEGLSFLNNFPNVSMNLKNVFLYNLWPQDNKAMLAAREVQLSFDIVDLLSNQITIHSLAIDQANIGILKNTEGLYNYQSGDTLETTFLTSLSKLTLTNTKLAYTDNGKQIIQTYIEKGELSGDITGRVTELEFNIMATFFPDWDFLKHKEHQLSLVGVLAVNRETDKWNINKMEVSNDDFNASINGSFTTNTRTDFNLNFKLNQTDLATVNEYLSSKVIDSYRNEVKKAKLSVKGGIKGTLSSVSSPALLGRVEVRDATFQFKDFVFERTRTDVLITGSNVKELNTYTFDFKEIQTKVKDEELLLGGVLRTINTPELTLNFISTIEAPLFNMFLPEDKTVKNGDVFPNIEVKLLYSKENVLEKLILNGFVRLENVNIGFMQTNELNDLSGTVTFKNQSMSLEKDAFPSFTASLSARKMKYDNILIKNLKAKTSSTGSDFKIEESFFTIFEGKGSIRGNYGFKDSTLSLNTALQNISIKTFFKQFNNFNQTAITDKNIEGTSNIQLLAILPYENDEVNMDKFSAQASIQINDGVLKNLQTFNAMCNYIEEKRVMKKVIDIESLRKKVRHISFSTLTNTVQVKNKKVFIPKMIINSSALELDIEGIHGFDQRIEYQFNFFLSDLMKKKGAETYEQYEIESGDRKWLKLSMMAKGTVDNPEFSVNKKKQKEILREKLKQESKLAKKLLKDEFKGNTKPASPYVGGEEQEMEFEHPASQKNNEQRESSELKTEPKAEESKKKKRIFGFELDDSDEEMEDVNVDDL